MIKFKQIEKKKIFLIIINVFLILLILITVCLYFWLRISQKPELSKEEERLIIETKKSEEIIKSFPQELINLNFDPKAKFGSGYQGKYSGSGLSQGQVTIFSQLPANKVFEHYIKVFQDKGYQIIVADAGKNPKIKNIVAKKDGHLAVILITERDSQTRIEAQWKEVE